MSRGKRSAGSSRAEFSAVNEESVDFDALVAGVLYLDGGVTKARFHDQGIKSPFDLGFLRERLGPNAAQAFETGFVIWANQYTTYSGRYAAFKFLRYGFGDFLRDRVGGRPDLPQIGTALVEEFEAHLLARHPNGRRSRTNKMSALEKIIERIRLLDRWAALLPQRIDFPAKRRDRKPVGTTKNKALSEADYDALWVATSRKMKRIVALHERRKVALAQWDGRSPTVTEAISNRFALAAMIARTYPAGLPPRHRATRGNWRQRVTVTQWNRALAILAPSIGELLPAIIILTTVFGLNPGVVQGMRHRIDYRTGSSLGRKRLFMFPLKDRGVAKAQRNTVVATEDGDNPARVIRYLEERTAFLRERGRTPHKAMLFLWLTKNGINSFAGSDFTFRQALSDLARRRNIEGLQLKKIRPSSLDRVHRITGGDLLKVRDYANHESIQTTFRDYETDAIAQRDTESLSRAMMQNDRFIASGGTIRPFLLPSELDKGSATPGYACLDPENSAIPGEAAGTLCKAYGRCPICPLAAIHPTPKAYAYLSALATRIDEALTKELVSGPEWIGRWSIVKKSLARQMLLFPTEVIIASGREAISELPPLE